jgi:hypothetical protein
VAVAEGDPHRSGGELAQAGGSVDLRAEAQRALGPPG